MNTFKIIMTANGKETLMRSGQTAEEVRDFMVGKKALLEQKFNRVELAVDNMSLKYEFMGLTTKLVSYPEQ